MDNTLWENIEDWFLGLSFVDDKWPQDFYFTLCRLWGKIEDVIWYRPKLFMRNLWVYKKILWSNYWFDSYYLLDLIKTKLEYDAKQYRKNGCTVNANNYALEMEYCALLLKKMTEDKYEESHLIEHDKKWGKVKFTTTPIKNSTSKRMQISRPNAVTEEEEKQQNKEFRQHMEDAWDEKQVDTKKLFNFIGENVYRWWD